MALSAGLHGRTGTTGILNGRSSRMKKQTVLDILGRVDAAGLGSFTSAQIVPGIAAFIAGIVFTALGGYLPGQWVKPGQLFCGQLWSLWDS